MSYEERMNLIAGLMAWRSLRRSLGKRSLLWSAARVAQAVYH